MAKSWRRFIPIVPHPDKPAVVPVVRLSGVIGGNGANGIRRNLNMAGVAGLLERAFAMRGAKAVALLINSPGGAPVQSGFIYKRIRDLAAEKDLPVLAFVEDVAASGGYMIALAGDEIIAHEASIIGSIGVVSGGFGFVEAIRKLGVERRLYTSGESKAMLDPFSPEKEEDVERLKAMQGQVHEYFKALVRDRRGDKLKAPRKQIFSGEFWLGEKARNMGLIDAVGDIRGVLRDRYGEDVKLRLITGPKRWLPSLAPGFPRGGSEERMASSLVEHALMAAEERLHWSRFGL